MIIWPLLSFTVLTLVTLIFVHRSKPDPSTDLVFLVLAAAIGAVATWLLITIVIMTEETL
ncbi:MAG: hypothetical protein M0R06_08155 [Sphaerochaeta sp.]|nr:hypothetical protein [Sphaerochaeta sp.]